ncbi:MAG: copper resistance protein NlpE N-terminal domain-containing protein [Marinilabiliales bacterium]|nr:copper resistance protein NlpE N-terminal domain-containing protein [Marinilabiliales bacterium]
MKNFNGIRIGVLTGLICFAALLTQGSTLNPQTNPHPKGDNSRTSVDWPGRYKGMLPCADCQGMEIALTIKKDLSYYLQIVYKGKTDKPIVYKGNFVWDDAGGVIELKGAKPMEFFAKFKVGENMLWQLDRSGKMIGGKLASNYILRKEVEEKIVLPKVLSDNGTPLIGTKWIMVELRGKSIVKTSAWKELPFLQIAEDGKFSGYAGCNRFTGLVDLKEMGPIRFRRTASTMMSCPDMQTEQVVVMVLRMTDNFSLKGNKLTLNQGRMAPLAVFMAEGKK